MVPKGTSMTVFDISLYLLPVNFKEIHYFHCVIFYLYFQVYGFKIIITQIVIAPR